MRKLALLLTSLCLAFGATSCSDDDDESLFCDIGAKKCENGQLKVCKGSFEGATLGHWNLEDCDAGFYCGAYLGKTACYERCTRQELGMRNAKDDRQVCTEVGRNAFFYVY